MTRPSKETIRRLKDSTNWIERRPRNLLDPHATQPAFVGRQPLFAHVTVACGPINGATPGKGSGVLQDFLNGFSDSAVDPTPVDLYNFSDKTVKINAYVPVSVRYGKWWIDNAACKDVQ